MSSQIAQWIVYLTSLVFIPVLPPNICKGRLHDDNGRLSEILSCQDFAEIFMLGLTCKSLNTQLLPHKSDPGFPYFFLKFEAMEKKLYPLSTLKKKQTLADYVFEEIKQTKTKIIIPDFQLPDIDPIRKHRVYEALIFLLLYRIRKPSNEFSDFFVFSIQDLIEDGKNLSREEFNNLRIALANNFFQVIIDEAIKDEIIIPKNEVKISYPKKSPKHPDLAESTSELLEECNKRFGELSLQDKLVILYAREKAMMFVLTRPLLYYFVAYSKPSEVFEDIVIYYFLCGFPTQDEAEMWLNENKKQILTILKEWYA